MSAAKSSELLLRIISALVLGTVVLAVTWYGGIAFRLLMALAALLIYREWSTITGSGHEVYLNSAGWFFVTAGAVIIAFADPVVGVLFAIGGAVLSALWAAVSSQRYWVSAGVIYAVLPAASLAVVRDMPAGLILILLIFVLVWATDIGAYFAGRSIGGPKLMPSVSPKKTWAGFFGGLIAAIVCTLILLRFFDNSGISIPIVIAGALSVLSQLGDLFESWIKRLFKVKDSGRLIPGHGGIMDRVDGLVVVAAAFYGMIVAGLI